jgi:hypothetical protein
LLGVAAKSGWPLPLTPNNRKEKAMPAESPTQNEVKIVFGFDPTNPTSQIKCNVILKSGGLQSDLVISHYYEEHGELKGYVVRNETTGEKDYVPFDSVERLANVRDEI